MGHYAAEMRSSISEDYKECPECDYDGYTESYKNEKTRCKNCKGRGYVRKDNIPR